MVGKERLELSYPCGCYHLKVVRLPISPLAQKSFDVAVSYRMYSKWSTQNCSKTDAPASMSRHREGGVETGTEERALQQRPQVHGPGEGQRQRRGSVTRRLGGERTPEEPNPPAQTKKPNQAENAPT